MEQVWSLGHNNDKPVNTDTVHEHCICDHADERHKHKARNSITKQVYMRYNFVTEGPTLAVII